MIQKSSALILLIGMGLVAQDKAPEVVELEITIAKRPPGGPPNPYLIKFAPKEALKLEGKGVASDKLRESLEKGLKYILDNQQADGSWKFDAAMQIRPEVPQSERGFAQVAGQAETPPVMTSLCCLALRSHEELAPDKIKPAVEKGLKFVLEEAPKMQRRDYVIWTWAFAVNFLCDEFKRAKDADLKAKITEAVKTLTEKILKDQRPGTLDLPKLPAKTPKESAKDPQPSWTEKMRESQGGLIGASPQMESEAKGGVLITRVQPGGPAEKAGIKGGDRIFEVDGHEINGIAHLMDVIDSLEPGKTVKLKVHRGMGANGGGQPKLPDDGGWSYYQWSESMSFTTATSVLALLDAKSIGVDVPQAEIDRGVRTLQACQFRGEGMSEDGFVYRMHANKGIGIDIRGAIGRVAVCSLAIFRDGKADLASVSDAIDTFVRRRGELDRVKGYPGNHFVRSFANASYYFYYGHYYSALAIHSLKDEALQKKYGAFIQEALVATQWKEGTWTDHAAFGQLYGTAMAMMAMGQLKFVTPDAYKTPTMQKSQEEH